ncbi:ras family-domain-containing protein [Diplogelasinospora grovesii]|uniref:GTP-binding protein RHO3 n=1 Tax=Diplogelasinospora grovesii TaxID=303347 RepID=A0AAN6NDZ5_9PEZI|nr:ras family-domain-containing protein [Diplogelasinospora grovesii]
MGAGDLNQKKSWHPQRSGNIAATERAEAEAIAERKKTQQRVRELAEERRNEEMQKALEAAGGKPRLNRVEWMYSGPADGQGGDAAEKEAYLLGKRRIDKILQGNESEKLQKNASQELITGMTSANVARDTAAKIREDPLLAIRKQEQDARQQLLASMGIDDDPRKKSVREEDKHRRHRHDDSDGDRRRHRRESRSPSRYDTKDDRRKRGRYDSEDERERRTRRRSPDERRYRSKRMDSRDGRGRQHRGEEMSRRSRVSRSRSPAPRRRRESPLARGDSPRRRGGESRSPSPAPRKRRDGPVAREVEEDERARKLAAMQEAASELDKARERRLAAIAEAERAAQEADARARQQSKKFGGEARGDGACGKTSLLNVFTRGYFPTVYEPTVFENYVHDIFVDNVHIELSLWDTAGQEEFDRLRSLSYDDTDLIMLCYSVDSRDSLENVESKWVGEIADNCPGVKLVLVALKCDLREASEDEEAGEAANADGQQEKKPMIKYDQGLEVARRINALRYLECSAMRNRGVNEAFTEAARVALSVKKDREDSKCSVM